MAPSTVTHQLPAPAIEVVPAAMVERHAAILAAAAALPALTTPEIAEQANRLLIDLADIEKAVAAEVERHSKPVHALHKLILEVGKKATEPLSTTKASLRGKVGAWNREQERLRQEAIAKAQAAQREAEAAAEAERRRLQAEADAKAAEARAKADADAKELEALLGTPVAPAPVAAPVVVAAPVPAAPAVVIPPPVKSAVVTRTVKVLVIEDEKAIPAYVAGIEVRCIDRAAVRKLLDNGIAVPGARLVEQEQDAMARRRA